MRRAKAIVAADLIVVKGCIGGVLESAEEACGRWSVVVEVSDSRVSLSLSL